MYISHENYDKKAEDYDKNRQAIEVEYIVKKIKETAERLGKETKDLVLGDFGCGTGNYVKVLMDHCQFKKVIGIEMNDGMIKVFKRKYSENKKVVLMKQSLFDMDLKGEKVDVAILNQVTHHLDTQKLGEDRISGDFPNLKKVIQNISDNIVPGGIMLINSSTPLQNMKGHWYINHLFPPKFKRVCILLSGISICLCWF